VVDAQGADGKVTAVANELERVLFCPRPVGIFTLFFNQAAQSTPHRVELMAPRLYYFPPFHNPNVAIMLVLGQRWRTLLDVSE
jgi:hypothetical protein